jgi:hemoglobin
MKGIGMKNTLRIASIVFLLPVAALAEGTLYDDMGGKPGMDRLVDASVDRYLTDPRIKDIFDESNIDRIRAELKDQFCMVAEGPCQYKGHDMTATHKGLHLTNANFNALVEDLQLAMDDQDISFPVQNRFLARLAPMQHQVVSK